MTEQELNEIEQRAAAATPGPWEGRWNWDWTDDRGRSLWACAEGPELTGKILADVQFDVIADAQFIAHAREDIPALIAEVRRLRAALTLIAHTVYTTRDDYTGSVVNVETLKPYMSCYKLPRTLLDGDK